MTPKPSQLHAADFAGSTAALSSFTVATAT
jgi:hypothetical protein